MSEPFDSLSPLDYLRGIRSGDIVPTIENLREALRTVLKDWQPIETAPKDGSYILVHTTLGNTHIAKFGLRYLGDPGKEAWVYEGKYIGGGVTHWMPMPEPPQGSQR